MHIHKSGEYKEQKYKKKMGVGEQCVLAAGTTERIPGGDDKRNIMLAPGTMRRVPGREANAGY